MKGDVMFETFWEWVFFWSFVLAWINMIGLFLLINKSGKDIDKLQKRIEDLSRVYGNQQTDIVQLRGSLKVHERDYHGIKHRFTPDGR